MTIEEIDRLLAKLRDVHPAEIGMRVGQAVAVLEELRRLRADRTDGTLGTGRTPAEREIAHWLAVREAFREGFEAVGVAMPASVEAQAWATSVARDSIELGKENS